MKCLTIPVRTLCESNTSGVKIKSLEINDFKVESGIWQGYILSPTQFNMLSISWELYLKGGCKINNLWSSDDTILFVTSEV